MNQVATLNDERDWRNGMRVKLLNRVVISMTLHLYFLAKTGSDFSLPALGQVWAEKTSMEGI